MQSMAGDFTRKIREVCLEYSYSDLEQATESFSWERKLGSGGFGSVFRAEMEDGSEIAVKTMDIPDHKRDYMREYFEDEIVVLSKFRHPNIIVLMGWARNEKRYLLMYELMTGGDLYNALRGASRRRLTFTSQQRLAAVKDAGTGLAHMHSARPRAFHRDIKSPNILLEFYKGSDGQDAVRAKIADFGLSMVAESRRSSSRQCKSLSGTKGYWCPSYQETGLVTEASEVFSFGIVMFEILLNLRPCELINDKEVYPIMELVRPKHEGQVQRCVENADPTGRFSKEIATNLARWSLLCIHKDVKTRPVFIDLCKELRAMIKLEAGEGGKPKGEQQNDQLQPSPAEASPPFQPPERQKILAPKQDGAAAKPKQAPSLSPPPLRRGELPQAAALKGRADRDLTPVRQGRDATPQGGKEREVTPVRNGAKDREVTPVRNGAKDREVTPVRNGGGKEREATPVLNGRETPPLRRDERRPSPPPRVDSITATLLLDVIELHDAPIEAHSLKPELRTVEVVARKDAEGRYVARVGRTCQDSWFAALEATSESSNVACISRVAVELSWQGSSSSDAMLEVVGSRSVMVDGEIFTSNERTSVSHMSRLSFIANQADGTPLKILTVLVRMPSQASPRRLDNPFPLVLKPTIWSMTCVYAKGFDSDALKKINTAAKTIQLDVFFAGRSGYHVGVKFQDKVFQLLSEKFREDISVAHMNFQEVPANSSLLLLENLSSHSFVKVGNMDLRAKQTCEVLSGDIISLGLHSSKHDPLLTFRLTSNMAPAG